MDAVKVRLRRLPDVVGPAEDGLGGLVEVVGELGPVHAGVVDGLVLQDAVGGGRGQVMRGVGGRRGRTTDPCVREGGRERETVTEQFQQCLESKSLTSLSCHFPICKSNLNLQVKLGWRAYSSEPLNCRVMVVQDSYSSSTCT